MKDFVLPFLPEELLAAPNDDRLWASDLPDVDTWLQPELDQALNALVGRLLPSHGADLASEESFSLVYALIQGWSRLPVQTRARVADLLLDAARRAGNAADKLRRRKVPKQQEGESRVTPEMQDKKVVAKVLVFALRWTAERLISCKEEGTKGRKKKVEGQEDAEDKQQRMVERQRCAVLSALLDMLVGEQHAWLWADDMNEAQRVAENVCGAGVFALDEPEQLKHRETKQAVMRCITEPLLRENASTNLYMNTVSKLAMSLRGGENISPFLGEVVARTHMTKLPRLLLMEVAQVCTSQGITTQAALQKAAACFFISVGERLPHALLAHITLLLPLLDVDVAPLRCGVVECFGLILASEGRPLPEGARYVPRANSQREAGEDAEMADGEPAEGNMQEDLAAEPAGANVFTIDAGTRAQLLDTLAARTKDKAGWVRARALQAFTRLVERPVSSVLPRERWPEALELAGSRLSDCNNAPRKAGLQLVRALVQRHPFGPSLAGTGDDRARSENVLKEIDEHLKELDEAPDEPLAKRRRLTKKTIIEEDADGDGANDMPPSIEAEDLGEYAAAGEEESDVATKNAQKRLKLVRMRECFSQRLRFVDILNRAGKQLTALLRSNTPSDATEAISVVVELNLQGLPLASAEVVNEVFGLVWSRHSPVQEASVAAFHKTFLEGREPCAAATALLEVYKRGTDDGEWSHSTLASVQECVLQAAKQELLNPSALFPTLVASLNTPMCNQALRALSALVAADPKPLAGALPQLCSLVRATAGVEALADPTRRVRLSKKQGEKNLAMSPAEELERIRLVCALLRPGLALAELRCEACWDLTLRCANVVVDHFAQNSVPAEWFGAAQATLDLSFEFANYAEPGNLPDQPAQWCPDQIWEHILAKMLCSMCGNAAAPDALESDGDDPDPEQEDGDDKEHVLEDAMVAEVAKDGSEDGESFQTTQLGCVVFVAGHLAVRMLVYLEGLHAALKRKRVAEEDQKMASAAGDEKDMGMAGQEEREAEIFAQMAEHTLLFDSKAILARIRPIILGSLLDPKLRNSLVMRRVGALSLCKFMVVSKQFCQEHLQLLFSLLFPPTNVRSSQDSLLQASQDSVMGTSGMGVVLDDLTLRQSLLVAVGDLLYRHPNIVEPWSDRLYKALGCTSAPLAANASAIKVENELRFTALLVLTHLVLNDMMKPRAALLTRALRLTVKEEEHPATARISKILFQELAKKNNNVVFNIAPELIARLCQGEGAKPGETAKDDEKLIDYLMLFVDKEKHTESLIERFSVRIAQCADISGAGHQAADLDSLSMAPPSQIAAPMSEDVEMAGSRTRAARAVQSLSYALSILNYTDRCVLRLHDVVMNRKILNQALPFHRALKEALMSVINKARVARRGRAGADKGGDAAMEDAAASVEGAAGGGGGKGNATVAALDAMEKAIVELTEGKKAKVEKEAAGPADAGANDAMEQGADVVQPKGGRGRKPGLKRQRREEAKENLENAEDTPAVEAPSEKPRARGKGKAKAKGGRGRPRRVAAESDDDCSE